VICIATETTWIAITCDAAMDAQPRLAEAPDGPPDRYGAGIRPAGATLVVAPGVGDATPMTTSIDNPNDIGRIDG